MGQWISPGGFVVVLKARQVPIWKGTLRRVLRELKEKKISERNETRGPYLLSGAPGGHIGRSPYTTSVLHVSNIIGQLPDYGDADSHMSRVNMYRGRHPKNIEKRVMENPESSN